jgi:hypothetical protein
MPTRTIFTELESPFAKKYPVVSAGAPKIFGAFEVHAIPFEDVRYDVKAFGNAYACPPNVKSVEKAVPALKYACVKPSRVGTGNPLFMSASRLIMRI